MDKKKTIKCPEHIHEGNPFFVQQIEKDKECIAILPYFRNGSKVLISEDIYKQIIRNWDNDYAVKLNISGGEIRGDGILIPSSVTLE